MSIDPNAVYDILVEECAAAPDDRDAFVSMWPACVEWRFMGNQGFGGKVHCSGGNLWVSCYPENDSAERQTSRARAQARLSRLIEGDS